MAVDVAVGVTVGVGVAVGVAAGVAVAPGWQVFSPLDPVQLFEQHS